MKKILSALLALALAMGFAICVVAENTEPNAQGLEPLSVESVDITAAFTDTNFRAAVYEHIGKTAPAPIYDTDVAEITSLKISKVSLESLTNGIKSLAGLEYFTSLTYLNCRNTALRSLPALPDGLEELYCAENKLTSLPSLPSGLRILDCQTNQLTSLPPLTDLTRLTRLNCGWNRLELLRR